MHARDTTEITDIRPTGSRALQAATPGHSEPSRLTFLRGTDEGDGRLEQAEAWLPATTFPAATRDGDFGQDLDSDPDGDDDLDWIEGGRRETIKFPLPIFAAFLTAVLIPTLAGVVLLPATEAVVLSSEATGWAAAQIVLMFGATMLYLHWRVAREAATGWLAAAVVVPAVHATPLALLAIATPGDYAPLPMAGPFIVLTSTVALVMTVLAARQVPVPRRLDPLALGAILGVAVAVVHLVLVRTDVLALGATGSPATRSLLTVIGVLTALTLASIAVLRRAARLPLTFGVAAVTLSPVLVPVEVGTDAWWQGSAVALHLFGAVLVCVVALELTRSAGNSHARQVQELSVRAARAEASNRRHEETLHELRSTVAGIASAAQLLGSEDADLRGLTRNRLQRMHDSELARLERMLANDSRGPVGLVSLDDVIAPLVVSLRATGHDVRWEPSGFWATGRADDVAEVVHILLDNAARHAAGSVISVQVDAIQDRVEVRVSDTGRGVTPSLVDSVFDRGTHQKGSVGQGIGLHIAHRLTLDLGGSLRLEQDLPVGGATFTVELPTILTRSSCRGHEH